MFRSLYKKNRGAEGVGHWDWCLPPQLTKSRGGSTSRDWGHIGPYGERRTRAYNRSLGAVPIVGSKQVRRQLLAARGVQIGIDHHGTLGALGTDYRASTPKASSGWKWGGGWYPPSPSPSNYGFLGSVVSSPSKVRGRVPASIEFLQKLECWKSHLMAYVGLFCWIYCRSSI